MKLKFGLVLVFIWRLRGLVCLKPIGVEPYITVNAGFGDAHWAAEEVEYINGSVKSPFGAMRVRLTQATAARTRMRS